MNTQSNNNNTSSEISQDVTPNPTSGETNKSERPKNLIYKDHEPKKVIAFGPNLFVSRQFKVAIDADTDQVWNTYDLINIRKKGYGYKNYSLDINFLTSHLKELMTALKELDHDIDMEDWVAG